MGEASALGFPVSAQTVSTISSISSYMWNRSLADDPGSALGRDSGPLGRDLPHATSTASRTSRDNRRDVAENLSRAGVHRFERGWSLDRDLLAAGLRGGALRAVVFLVVRLRLEPLDEADVGLSGFFSAIFDSYRLPPENGGIKVTRVPSVRVSDSWPRRSSINMDAASYRGAAQGVDQVADSSPIIQDDGRFSRPVGSGRKSRIAP